MSNPTTPFSWQMPTSTDLVTDLPADFEVFGQAVATSMADLLGGTTGQVLSKTSATDMDFTWIANDQGDITGVTASTGLTGGGTSGTVSLAIDSTVATLTGSQTLTNKTLTSPALTTPTISTLTTNGDLLYGTGSGALSRLGIGSTAQILTVSGGVPAWSSPSGGGKVLQVVNANITTSTTISTTTQTDTNITATITPTVNTSKILILINAKCLMGRNNTTAAIGGRIMRGSTVIMDYGDSMLEYIETDILNKIQHSMIHSLNFLDSPATTSATTYKLQAKVPDTSSSAFSIWNGNGVSSQITLLEIGA